jgi:hypothetical protein
MEPGSLRHDRLVRFRHTAAPAWFHIGLLLGVVPFAQGGTFAPSGDPARDTIIRPRADVMKFCGAALLSGRSLRHWLSFNTSKARQAPAP